MNEFITTLRIFQCGEKRTPFQKARNMEDEAKYRQVREQIVPDLGKGCIQAMALARETRSLSIARRISALVERPSMEIP
jgi:hypothetical protein